MTSSSILSVNLVQAGDDLVAVEEEQVIFYAKGAQGTAQYYWKGL